jgi:predicted nucleic acid-binding protein
MKAAKEFVLDCSVTMTWCFTEEATKDTLGIRDSLLHSQCYVPSIWSLEVNNVLWVATRNKKISELQAKRFKYLLKALPIHVDHQASDLMNDVIFELSKNFSISCYDAAYLELALRENLPLASLDKTLNKAAKAAGVTLLC